MSIDLLQQVARATALREGAEGVAQVLRIVHAEGRITLKELSRKSGLPLPVLAAVRGELEKAQLLDRRAGMVLTERGRHFVHEQLQVTTRHNPVCPTCFGRGIVVGTELGSAVDRLAGFLQSGPSVDVTLDQAPSQPESSVRRALYMYQAGAVEGQRVILLGDDDLVSLAIGLLGQSLGNPLLPRRLTVVETDVRWIELIQRVAAAEGFQIECLQHDLREPLPRRLLEQFDTFETDPPYTLEGMTLFVSRALHALKPGAGGQGFLSFGHKSPAEMLEVQGALVSMGLAVREVIPGFNEYAGASILGGQSQMIHLLTTPATQPRLAQTYYDEPIYTGQSSPTTRQYACTQCKTRYLVGQGQAFVTIERLKAAGCGECGGTRFRYLGRAGA